MNKRCSCGAEVSIPRLTGLCDQCLMRTLFDLEKEISLENEVKRQIYMMEHPEKWPKKPFLPLIHLPRPEPGERNAYDTGFLYLHPRDKPALMPTVYLGIIYSAVETIKGFRGASIARVRYLSHDEVMELPTINYRTFASMVSDGWRVDE